ncbi:MAG: glycosyltransferase family 2 protein [Chlorobium sp.]|nr:glycosyltransferase family 2 protein [Chlorobium sp.]
MPTLSLVTFISGNEVIGDKFIALAARLRQKYSNLAVYAFTNQQEQICDKVQQIVSPGTTKYARIQRLLDETHSSFCLCIDNDVTPDLDAVLVFLQEAFAYQADLSWGCIGVVHRLGMTAKLVEIDKMLSHHVIRPTLWKLGWGASLPGQLFLMKSKSFYGRLDAADTVFDDLTIGICARRYNCLVYFTSKTLGYEEPKITVTSLITQRIRWAKGFAQVLAANLQNPKSMLLVLVHGVFYHLLCFIIWGVIVALFFVNANLALLLWLLVSFFLTFGHKYLLVASIFYTLMFPIIHLTWIASMVSCFGGKKKI